jgi:hypothetical protein
VELNQTRQAGTLKLSIVKKLYSENKDNIGRLIFLLIDSCVDKKNVLCPLCNSPNLQVFYEVKNIPTSCNILWKSKSEAINCPKGDIKLAFCPSCTFVTNCALEPQKNQYDSLYDNSLFYSAHFKNFVKEFVMSLIQEYDLHNKTIMEVTCGKVDFLSLFCSLGRNKGIKISTLSDDYREDSKVIALRMSVLQKNLEESKDQKTDFVFSYHELEHMNSPKHFLSLLRKRLENNSEVIVFFAVPNSLKAFYEGDFSDIIYEHTSYFTVHSLRYLFTVSGFRILDIYETKEGIFDSIYIVAKLRTGLNSSPEIHLPPDYSRIESSVFAFAEKSREMVVKQTENLVKLLNRGLKVVIWGAGARGVTFLNLFGDTRLEYAVDINPRKQGMFVPGTGQLIVKPEFLQSYNPEVIVIANPAYKKEIKKIVNTLKINPEFIKI